MARLCAVRFRGTGVNDIWELAVRIPNSTPNADERLIYGDREVFCPSKMLKTSMDVDVQMMLRKAPVLHAVRRDREALRQNAPEYEDVCRERPRTSCFCLQHALQSLRDGVMLCRTISHMRLQCILYFAVETHAYLASTRSYATPCGQCACCMSHCSVSRARVYFQNR